MNTPDPRKRWIYDAKTHHVIAIGDEPKVTAGSALGPTGKIISIRGTDGGNTIEVWADGQDKGSVLATVTFNIPYDKTPIASTSGANQEAALADLFPTPTRATLQIETTKDTLPAGTYKFSCMVYENLAEFLAWHEHRLPAMFPDRVVEVSEVKA